MIRVAHLTVGQLSRRLFSAPAPLAPFAFGRPPLAYRRKEQSYAPPRPHSAQSALGECLPERERKRALAIRALTGATAYEESPHLSRRHLLARVPPYPTPPGRTGDGRIVPWFARSRVDYRQNGFLTPRRSAPAAVVYSGTSRGGGKQERRNKGDARGAHDHALSAVFPTRHHAGTRARGGKRRPVERARASAI